MNFSLDVFLNIYSGYFSFIQPRILLDNSRKCKLSSVAGNKAFLFCKYALIAYS